MATPELRSQVTCSVCMKIYTEPVMLACGHNFCHGCISKIFDNQDNREYFCPRCKHNFGKRPELQKNSALASIAALFPSEEPEERQPVHFCSNCVTSPVPAVALCVHCEAFLCDLHKEAHNKGPEHVLTDPSTPPEDRKCPVHKKILEYHCLEDETRICLQCLISDHNGHKMRKINDSLHQNAENRKAILEKLSSKKEETEAMLQSLQNHKKKIDETAKDAKGRVTRLMKDIRRQHEDLEKRILTDISRQQQQISQSVSDHMEQLEKRKTYLHEKIIQAEEMGKKTNSLSALQAPFEVLDDENSLGRDIVSKLIDDVGGLKEDMILETLYSGLSNIAKGVEVDAGVQKIQSSIPPAAVLENPNIENKNVTNGPQKPQIPPRSKTIPNKLPQVPPVCRNKSSTQEVLLVVNTASKNVIISNDQKTVSRSDKYQSRPETLERFLSSHVLSSRGFSSGKHELEMEVSKKIEDSLFIGMCYPRIDRRGSQSPTEDIWGTQFGLFSYEELSEIKWVRKLSSHGIKIKLDYEAGQLSFYDLSDPIQHLHTFSAEFTQPLHLMISVQGSGWVNILK
ncbi:E3 ubiquitin-protein ligase TRIM39-like [Rana temporaria]|uniref:E3 ubiquitin-protein ligase TRIM39-like n=1 Tax=Rana temporaria TaxID=8407 RepID=UPI001AAD4989|nr:E3 ubiquitin-protein ligase TRIM39-like [Rana temporaria]